MLFWGPDRMPDQRNSALFAEQIDHPILAKVARVRLFGKSPVGVFLRLNTSFWRLVPPRLHNLYLVRACGDWLHSLVLLHVTRRQYFGTYFLRNRPLLELMRRLIAHRPKGSSLRIAVLGCSIGADVYSILWTIRSARPDLKVLLCALDLSKNILSLAEKGVYAPDTSELVGSSIFERLTPHEKVEMFDWEGDQATVKPWLREAVTWKQGDASNPELIRFLGPQDIVVANNFLCHMGPAAAQDCLRNIAGLVDRGGYLIASGVDLDVRATVARELGWRPVPELIEEIHEGDPELRGAWPCQWWGLEPLNKKRADWQMRYAAVFRLTGPAADSRSAAPRVTQRA
jgi:hypothetical protein